MTDRCSGFIVTLEEAIREDDAQPTIDAIRQIKGVVSVKPVVQDITLLLAKQQAGHEIFSKIYNFLYILENK